MRTVIALDGEVLVSTAHGLGMAGQREAIAQVAEQIAMLIEEGHEVVVTHGNAPQVGSVLFRAEVASHAIHTLPLDICGADTQGATGYMLQQALQNQLRKRGLQRNAAAVVTQVLVDPGQSEQVKGIGPFFDRDRAQSYENSRGWNFVLIPGHGYQRAVPALYPQQVIEGQIIHALVEDGVVVICAGGGGIPVCLDEQAQYVGIEGVVDKAHTTLLLAGEIDAEIIIFVVEMEHLERAFHQSLRQDFTTLALADVEQLLAAETAPAGEGLNPELVAACSFLRANGQRKVFLTPPEKLAGIFSSCCGVAIIP